MAAIARQSPESCLSANGPIPAVRWHLRIDTEEAGRIAATNLEFVRVRPCASVEKYLMNIWHAGCCGG